MNDLLKNIAVYIVLSILITFGSRLLGSDFIFNYLREDLIGLLLTLLAINTATLGLIVTKIQDLVITHKIDFSSAVEEMKLSLKEQIALIIVSVVVLTVNDSEIINFQHKHFIMSVILVSIFIYAVDILWDTGKAVFVIVDEINKLNKK